MSHYSNSDDRPDPSEQPLRARVPDSVSSGAFSTGVIVMTAQTEFILDFVQNLGRPHQIVARVVMPHNVLPQLVDALQRNMELYRNRWGELPYAGSSSAEAGEKVADTPQGESTSGADSQPTPRTEGQTGEGGQQPAPEQNTAAGSTPGSGPSSAEPNGGGSNPGIGSTIDVGPAVGEPTDEGADPPQRQTPPQARQASAQEIYDDLKIRDELLSGAYANAVMIGHGPHEFSFDFITNFYPHSAVSARVFLAAGQIPRLYDSLKGTWDQLRNRMQPPPDDYGPPDSGDF